MTKISTRIKSILLAFTMTIQVFAGAGAFSITAYADTTNADGSITKTATSAARSCPGGSTHTSTLPHNCYNCGGVEGMSTNTYCDMCGALIHFTYNETARHLIDSVVHTCTIVQLFPAVFRGRMAVQ